MTTDPLPALSFDRPVPPAQVNRRSAREVFVTDHTRLGPDEFALAVLVPHDHPLWSDQAAGRHDPAFVIEAFRQAFVVVRHEYLGVAKGTPSAVQRLTLAVTEPDAFRAEGTEPLRGVVKVRVSRGSGTFDMDGDFLVGATRAATLSFAGVLFPTESYRELRDYQRSRRAAGGAEAPAAGPIDPALVGRRDRRNVVIAPAVAPHRYPVVVDRSHPSFFDRAYDHLPASLLIEAMRQSALRGAAEAGLPTDATALVRVVLEFGIFAETDVPATCAVSVTGRPGTVAVSVGVDQADVRVAGGTLELTAPDA
ncbi:AfsA-related hotdog domain-containing protein [Streptomyces rubrogriseus]|uniref:AfsA-related hotdog domain-containing protein n=1 Tax=Streptomyces rubrogriseus TaxID=194673 RepID=UPI0037D348D7